MRLTLADLAIIASVEQTAQALLNAQRLDAVEPPYSPGDTISVEPGDRFILRYDDGRQERTVVVTI